MIGHGRTERSAHATDFTVIANAALRDERLTLKARGLLALLLSRPDDWVVLQGELENVGPDGRSAVRAALTELEDAGYLDRSYRNTPNGRRVSSVLREIPQAQGRFPATGGPRRETGANEVPTNEKPLSRKSAVGSVVQSPLVNVVTDEPCAVLTHEDFDEVRARVRRAAAGGRS